MTAEQILFPSDARDGTVRDMATIREIRLAAGPSRRGFAACLEIPLQTYRISVHYLARSPEFRARRAR